MSEIHNVLLKLAEPSDSALLAEAALAAGGGLYEHLLAQATRGIEARTAVATAIAASDEGLCWRNAILAESPDGAVQGAAIAYPAGDYRLTPLIAQAADPAAQADLAPLFAVAPPTDSFYLHAIWTDPAARGRGVGALLLDAVIALGRDQGFHRTSLHVWRDNAAAMALYHSRGFVALATIDVPRRPLMPHDGGKLLMAT